jgi:hypothetical protein
METVGLPLLAMSLRQASARFRVAAERETLRQGMARLDGDRTGCAFQGAE